MRISRLRLTVGLLMALTGCSRSPTLFQPVPLPQMTALTCELTAVHDGALNPGYKRGKSGSVMKLTLADIRRGAFPAQVHLAAALNRTTPSAGVARERRPGLRAPTHGVACRGRGAPPGAKTYESVRSTTADAQVGAKLVTFALWRER